MLATKNKKTDKSEQSTKTKKNNKLKQSFKIQLFTSSDKIVFNKVIIDPTKLRTFEKYKLNYITKSIKQIKQKPFKIFPEIEKNSIIFANINNNGVELTTFDKYLESQKNIKEEKYNQNLSTRQQIDMMNQYINNTATRLALDNPVIGNLQRDEGHYNIYFEITAIPNERLVIAIYKDVEFTNEYLNVTCLYDTPSSYIHFTIFPNYSHNASKFHIYYMVNPTPNSFMTELIQFVNIVRKNLFGREKIPRHFWTDDWLTLDKNSYNDILHYLGKLNGVLNYFKDNV